VYTHELEGNRDYCDCLFLYSNGVVVNPGVVRDCNMSKLTKTIPTVIFDSRYEWGVFTVDTINITLKRWYPGINYPFLISTGVIINDSTFVLNEVTNQYGRHEFAMQDTFHFQHLELKPDSVSKFIIK
jgi:hypothetical protein